MVCRGVLRLLRKLWQYSKRLTWQVADKFEDEDLVLTGHSEESMMNALSKYIPTAALVGRLCLGALTILVDFSGEFITTVVCG